MGESEPKIERVKAIDVRPYRWAMWCSYDGREPFANDICNRGWTDDGERIVFMLESFNFYFANPEEVLELIPIPNSSLANDAEDEKKMKACAKAEVAASAVSHERAAREARHPRVSRWSRSGDVPS